MRLISPLISGILRVLKKLLKYFNSTTILAAFAPSFPVEPVISCFYLNETLLPVNYQDRQLQVNLVYLSNIVK